MRRSSQAGFILVMVLAMLVILSMLAGTVAAVTQRLRDQEASRKRVEDAQTELESTRATLLYLLMTQRMTVGGLTVDDRMVLTEDERLMQSQGERPVTITAVGNEISLDNRVYAGLGGTAFSLQDDRGLLGVNWTPFPLLERWVTQRRGGVEGTPAITLANLLHDYQDEDDLYRLNSAERDQYEKEQRRPPSNQALATPLELRAIKGWDDLLQSTSDTEVLAMVTVSRSPTINVNTATREVLQVLPGMDEANADRVVAARALVPFPNQASFYNFIGQPVAEENHVTIYPTNSGAMRLWVPGAGAVRSIHWEMTPWDDGGRPWREDYELNLSQDDSTNPPTLARPASALFAGTLPQDPRAAGSARGR